MTENDKKPDPKEVSASFNRLLRDQRDLHRVQVTSATSRAELNDALRIAAGHEPQHEEADREPGSFPWRSLTSRDGDA